MDTTPPPPAPPPAPPPTQAARWDPTRPDLPGTAEQRQPRPMTERLPEIAATIGAVLVVAGVVALISAAWTQLTAAGRGTVLAGVGVALTAAGIYVETARRDVLGKVASLTFAAATATVAGAATLLGSAGLEPRVAIAVGGLVGAAHAAWSWARSTSSGIRATAFTAALLYGAGPAGTQLTDRWGDQMFPLTYPFVGLFDVTYRTDAFWLAAGGWTVAGVLLLAASTRAGGAGRRAATTCATVALFGAALMANVGTDSLGAFAALTIVVSYLVYGLVTARPGVTTVGGLAGVFVSLRVAAALFSGQLAVIVAAIATGASLLGWAVHAARRNNIEAATTEPGSADEPAGPPPPPAG